jgi:hypothetical protein
MKDKEKEFTDSLHLLTKQFKVTMYAMEKYASDLKAENLIMSEEDTQKRYILVKCLVQQINNSASNLIGAYVLLDEIRKI